ncbi:MAG: hypothetical protein KF861_20160, partial [Planctomycetaceae bacterium]|nr:hypothetical protein [Planctomycetaceae bacterium]
CDSRYYASDENIGQCLFSFIEEHQREIQLPQEAGAEQSDMSSSNKRYELTGCVLGGLIGLAFWFWPLPVGWAVSLFDLQGNFADYMYLAAPVALLFPLIGAIIGRRMDK